MENLLPTINSAILANWTLAVPYPEDLFDVNVSEELGYLLQDDPLSYIFINGSGGPITIHLYIIDNYETYKYYRFRLRGNSNEGKMKGIYPALMFTFNDPLIPNHYRVTVGTPFKSDEQIMSWTIVDVINHIKSYLVKHKSNILE